MREIANAAARYSEYLDSVKAKHPLTPHGWYPYPTLAAFPVLADMLQGKRQDLLGLAGARPILDIGCGDGALAFFLESLGCAVKAIDQPGTNFNGTSGFLTLKAALNSAVDLEIRDLDADLGLSDTYPLAFCMGVLYHLKNPLGFLEGLAPHIRYCVLSTRIAQFTARGTPIEDDPVAVLLGPEETNSDPTNYWIFSEAGLRKLFDRTGWELCDYLATGRRRGSDPVHAKRDQRAFCLLRSKHPQQWLDVDLADGWHAMESDSWRWTERTFAVRLPTKSRVAPTLHFRFIVPESLVKTGPIRLHAVVAGSRLPSCEYISPGEHTYVQTVPVSVPEQDDLLIRFELDRAWNPGTSDQRELGVQVAFWGDGGSSPRPLCPITLS